MRQILPCLPLALLFLANAVPSNGQKQQETVVEVEEGAPLVVECALRPEQRAEWRAGGGAPAADLRPGEAGGQGGLTARLTAPHARPAHAGLYTCAKDSPRVRVRVRSSGAGTEAAPPAESGAELDAGDITYFEWRGNFSLNCTGLAGPAVNIVWKKDEKVVEEIPELKGHVLIQATGGVPRAQLTLAGRARDQDAGNYTCEAGGQTRAWQVHARPVAKMNADTNVVEGQKLKLTCKILGLPLPSVKWYYSNESADDKNASEVSALFGERVELAASEQGVPGGELVVGAAQRADAGWFRCEPAVPGAVPAVTRLRVKDMYAALWPFLGICAEVFVLCAIILVYEKRRTKPELDDSDTDNHDQKKS